MQVWSDVESDGLLKVSKPPYPQHLLLQRRRRGVMISDAPQFAATVASGSAIDNT